MSLLTGTHESRALDKAAGRWSVSGRERQVSTLVWDRPWSQPKSRRSGSTREAGTTRTLATHNQRPRPKAGRRRQGGKSPAIGIQLRPCTSGYSLLRQRSPSYTSAIYSRRKGPSDRSWPGNEQHSSPPIPAPTSRLLVTWKSVGIIQRRPSGLWRPNRQSPLPVTGLHPGIPVASQVSVLASPDLSTSPCEDGV